jgi:hypothetical protein
MPITGWTRPGHRQIRFDLDPRTALDVLFALMASLHAEETTQQQRITVAGMLPQYKRALVSTGIVSMQLLTDFEKHLLSKPAPPPLDAVIRDLVGGH